MAVKKIGVTEQTSYTVAFGSTAAKRLKDLERLSDLLDHIRCGRDQPKPIKSGPRYCELPGY